MKDIKNFMRYFTAVQNTANQKQRPSNIQTSQSQEAENAEHSPTKSKPNNPAVQDIYNGSFP